MIVRYQRETVDVEEFASILERSGLGARRPLQDRPRLQRMVDGANLIVTAREDGGGTLVGIARALTDWSYACYLSDLAVDRAWQGQGIGRELIAQTQAHAGDECMCLLVSAPDSVEFYRSIAMPQTDRAFLFPRAR